MHTKNIEVTVYTQEQVLTGTITLPANARLSDFINGQSSQHSDFIVLSNVKLKPESGDSQTVYINKSSIKMITTRENESTRGLGSGEGHKRYPYVEKKPTKAVLHLPGYDLSGNLYCNGHRTLLDLFEDAKTFLPCTHSMITDMKSDSCFGTDFVTINKNFVQSLHEEIN